MSYKMKVTYFKPSGKYYAEGKYETEMESIPVIHEEFKQMMRSGNCPGLVKGATGYFAVLDCDAHHAGYPIMIKTGVSL